MAEERTGQELSTEKLLPSEGVVARGDAEAAGEAIAAAPAAVKRSMPMALSIMLGILLAALAGWFFYYLTWFILVLYLSFIAATILEAPVQWLKRHGIRRGFGSVIVMVGGLVLVAGVLWVVGNSIYNQTEALSANLKQAPQRINKTVNDLRKHFEFSKAKKGQAATAPAEVAAGGELAAAGAASQTQAASAPADGDFDVGNAVNGALPTMKTVFENAMTGVEIISWLVIMYFIVLYMLVDGADHLKTIRCLLPKDSRLEATKLFNEMSQAHRGWALASLSNVGSSTILTGTGLWILGVPGAYVLGFFAGLGELIPNIGPLIGAMPALLLTLIAEPDKFFYVVGMFVIVQTIQSYTISPMVMKFGVELPVLVTIISVLVFGVLFGFLGIMVAIPLVADLVVLWGFISARREKDTTNYDLVNAPPDERRTPMSPDNTPPGRLRKMFRRGKEAEASAGAKGGEGKGMSGLEAAEKRSGG
jgi:predicted PurR-regulated permease PerM